MRLYRINPRGAPALATRVQDDRFVLIETPSGKPCNDLSEFFSYDRKVREDMLRFSAVKADDDRSFLCNDVSISSPIEGARQDIICLAENYMTEGAALPPKTVNTVYFSKRFCHATGDGEMIPAHSDVVQKLDYETELLIILGETVYNVSASEAMDAVFGYSVINDVSARDLQALHKQWYRGKSLDGFTASGPCIVTADEIPDVHNLMIRTTVNGTVKQLSNTGNMIKKVGTLIAELSKGMTLCAGTLIAAGTPSGCGKDQSPQQFLKPGDTVSCYIESIGTLTNTIGE